MTYKTLKRKIKTLLEKPDVLILKAWHLCEPIVSDETFLRVLFRLKVGYWPNLKNPRSFNEKIQWLKLHYKRPEYTEMVDKVAAKEYVAKIIGEQYIIPTLGVWDSVEDIDWESLPNKFVLKAAHDSGGVVVCKDKAKLDIAEAKAMLIGAGRKDYTKYNKEYVYHDVPHRFIAEELLENGQDNSLPDYKFFCFNGEPKYCQVIRDRHTKETIDFYDMEWNHKEFVGLLPPSNTTDAISNGLTPVARPKNLDEMKDICQKLAKDIPFVRVDLYVIDDKKYFGELTFYPASGLGVFTPDEWNKRLGDLLTLPNADCVCEGG